jgi:hypothetical protein
MKMIGPRREHGGRPQDWRRRQLAETYQLTWGKVRKISCDTLDQLERCQSDEARRILLGIRER